MSLQCAKEARIDNLVVEGDCLTLNNSLKSSNAQDTFTSFLITEILSLAASFSFCSWSFVRRNGIKVAHDLAHLQPYSFSRRVWDVDPPDSILDWRPSICMTFLVLIYRNPLVSIQKKKASSSTSDQNITNTNLDFSKLCF